MIPVLEANRAKKVQFLKFTLYGNMEAGKHTQHVGLYYIDVVGRLLGIGKPWGKSCSITSPSMIIPHVDCCEAEGCNVQARFGVPCGTVRGGKAEVFADDKKRFCTAHKREGDVDLTDFSQPVKCIVLRPGRVVVDNYG